MKPFRSDVAFASFLTYCPRGDTEDIERAQNFMRRLKEDRMIGSNERAETASALVARRLRELRVPFTSEFLGTDTALVPVPRSSLLRKGTLWPSFEIAHSLRKEGFGGRVVTCLRRIRAVPKAATSKREERPKARAHFDSIELDTPLALPRKVTLIDDVVTRGLKSSALHGRSGRYVPMSRSELLLSFEPSATPRRSPRLRSHARGASSGGTRSVGDDRKTQEVRRIQTSGPGA